MGTTWYRAPLRTLLFASLALVPTAAHTASGAIYAQDSAIGAFPVGEDASEGQFEQAEHWTKLMRTPPRVWIKDSIRVR